MAARGKLPVVKRVRGVTRVTKDRCDTVMAESSPANLERRAEPRDATRQPVRAYFGENLGLWADCELRDLSAGGAKIHVSSLYKLPPRFSLLLHQQGVAFDVVLKWRRGDLAGLSFEARHDLQTATSAWLIPLRDAWLALQPGSRPA